MKKEIKDKSYKLTGGRTPLSFSIPVEDSSKTRLMYWDEKKKLNRPLRYARNQQSPFVDEQDGEVIMEPVVFIDGLLTVPKENQVLQEFLHYHPMNGIKFEEIDKERDASKEVERMDIEDEARMKARELDLETLEDVYRVVYGKDPSKMTSTEIKRDVRVYATNHPESFLNSLKGGDFQYKVLLRKILDSRLLYFKNNNKEVFMNIDGNKGRLLSIPFGKDPFEYLSEYLKTDGANELNALEQSLENQE